MIKKLLPLALMGCLMTACGDFWKEEDSPDPVKQETQENDNQGELHKILENEVITGRSFVTSLSEGDVIHLSLRGEKISKRFSSYSRSFRSHWRELICKGIIDGCRFRHRAGSCQLIYSREDNNVSHPILLENDISKFPFRLIIGDRSYPLNNVSQDGLWVLSNLTVTTEMLREGTELYIEALKGKDYGAKKVGFLSFGSCQGRGQIGFKVEGPTGSHTISNKTKNQFKVSLTLERKN